MPEIDLLINYPKTKRNLDERLQQKTDDIRRVARQFGKDFFDGDRKYGYGGYQYHPRFWQPVIPTFQEHYGLAKTSSVLDVGCAKGFMLQDFRQLIPGITVAGLDVSTYAIENAIPEIKPFLKMGNAKALPYPDKSFDLVISINTIHNLPCDECNQAVREIQRVTRKYAFITVDAYRTSEEKRRMDAWNLTAKTYLQVDAWIALFKEAGYKGDYYWFIP